MKRLLILAVVVALALVLVIPAATAETMTDEKDNGVTVVNDNVLAAPNTSQATIGFVADQYGPPPATHTSVGKGIGPTPD